MQTTLLKKSAIAAAAIAAAMMFGGGASAATITDCPDGADDNTRVFTLTTEDPISNSCYYTGAGNDSNDDVFLDKMTADFGSEHGLVSKVEFKDGVLEREGSNLSLLNQSVVNLLDGLGGEFTLDTTGILNPILVFKTGLANTEPGYAAFSLTPSGQTEGSWSVTFNQKLSHVSLYGSESMTPIPLPAAGWLLLAGIGGLAAFRRRKSV